MARIQCRSCDYDGEGTVVGAPKCPRCGSDDCRAALSLEEMPADWWERLAASTIPPEHVWDSEDAEVAGVFARHGIADPSEARGWPPERLVHLALELLRTVPEHTVPAVDEAMRLLSQLDPRR